MKKVRSGVVAGLALAAAVLGAQAVSAGQLNLLPILQLSGQYSDNVFFEENGKKSDTFFLVNPGVALDYASTRFVGSLSYQLGLQRHVDFDERDNDVHRFDGNVGFNLSKGWFLDANDNLYVTNDPLAYDASGDRIQRDSFVYNHFAPGISYIFSNHGMRVAARYDRIDIDYDNLTDSYQNGYGANVSFKLGDRSTLAGDYFEFDRHFAEQNVEFNTVDYKGRRIGARIDRVFSNRWSGTFYGGYEERKYELDADRLDFDSAIFDMSLTGDYPEYASFTLGFTQHLNDLAIQGAYKIQRFNVDVRKSLADRLRLDFNGYYQDSDNEQIPESAQYLGFRVEGQYLVARFLNLWLGYEYTDRDSDDLEAYTENRVNFGLSLSYGI